MAHLARWRSAQWARDGVTDPFSKQDFINTIVSWTEEAKDAGGRGGLGGGEINTIFE